MSDYRSCVATLDKVLAAFCANSTRSEWQSNHNIGMKKAKLIENMDNHKNHLKHTLESIDSSHESYKSLLENPASRHLTAEYVNLEKEKSRLEMEIEKLQNELQMKQEMGFEVDETENAIDILTQEKKEKIQMKLPALKHKLALYKRIFVVEWNENNDQNISGLIGITDNDRPRFDEFALRKNQMSHFELVNQMWKLSDVEIKDDIHELQQMMQQLL